MGSSVESSRVAAYPVPPHGRALIALGIFVVTLGAFAAPAAAQYARAEVSGSVTAPDGLALPGVAVEARNEDSGLTRTVPTSASGGYFIRGLVPGVYTLTFSLQNFRTIERLGVGLHVGEQPVVNQTMELAGALATATVEGRVPMVETRSKQVGSVVTLAEVSELPSINRSFVRFATLVPGVAAVPDTRLLISVNGQSVFSNQFSIDGAGNDENFSGSAAGPQVRTRLEAMQEFQIITSQFDAEFGRAQGGIINAVTKSGTNEFHGVGFFYAQDSAWNSTPFFVERAGEDNPEVTFKGLGGTFGVPIVRDQTHFFTSYEYLTPNQVIVRDYSNIGRSEQSFTGSTDIAINNIVLKLDHQLARNHKMSVRWLWEYGRGDNQEVNGQEIETQLRAEEDFDWTLVGSLDTVISDTAFNNLRMSFTREDLHFATRDFFECGATFECMRSFAPMEDRPNIDEGHVDRANHRIDNSLQFDDTLSWYLPDKVGDHDIRMGGHFSSRQVDRDDSRRANGRFQFGNNRPFDIDDPTTYPNRFDILIGSPRGQNPEQDLPPASVVALFFQDDWQPLADLTINLGMRWDWEEVTPGDTDNVAWRLGFAYDPVGDGKTLVRGGWGRFYDRYLFAEWEDPIQLGVFNTTGITRSWTNNVANRGEFVRLFNETGLTTLAQMCDYLRDLMEAPIDVRGFNPQPAVEGAHLGFRDAPYSDQLSIGAERQVLEDVTVGVDFIRTESRNQLIRLEFNPFSRALAATDGRPGSDPGNGRPNISVFQGEMLGFGRITMDAKTGLGAETTYNALQLSVRKRYGPTRIGPLSGRISYTLGDSSGNVDNRALGRASYFQFITQTEWNFDTDALVGESPDPNLDHPQNVDRPNRSSSRRHNFVISGSWTAPGTSWRDNGGLVLSGIVRFLSGDHFTITNNARLDNNNREVAETGTYNPNNPNDISRDDVEFDGTINGAGAVCLVLGYVWGFAFPINKNLWTSSFVLFAGGWSLLLLALFYAVIDVWGYTKWAFFFIVIGMNSILVYMADRFIDIGYTTDFFFEGLLRPLGEPAGLVLWWIGFVLVEWAVLYFLYRKKVFLRV